MGTCFKFKRYIYLKHKRLPSISKAPSCKWILKSQYLARASTSDKVCADTFSLAATSVICEDAATPFCCEASAMICGLWVDNDRFLLIFGCIYPLKMVTQIQIENLLKKKQQTQIPLLAAFMKEFAPFQYHLARCTFNGEEILSLFVFQSWAWPPFFLSDDCVWWFVILHAWEEIAS